MDYKFLSKTGIILLLLFPFFKPAAFNLYPILTKFYSLAAIAVAAVIAILFLIRGKISFMTVGYLGFAAALLISTLINHGSNLNNLINAEIKLLAICMLTEMVVEEHAEQFLEALFILLFALTFLNLVFILVYPDGFYHDNVFGNKYNFLDIDNALAKYLIPGAIAGTICKKIKARPSLLFSMMVWAMWAMVYLTAFLTWSATFVVGVFILLIFFLFLYRNKGKKQWSFLTLSILYVVIFLGIIIFRVQNLFSYFIEGVLQKDLTFSNRTLIWDGALKMIQENFWVGYGWNLHNVYVPYKNLFLLGAHNHFLQILLAGGCMTFVFFVWQIVLCGMKLQKYKNNQCASIIAITIFAFWIMMLMEYYGFVELYYVMLILGYNIDKISKQAIRESNTIKASKGSRYIIDNKVQKRKACRYII